MEIAQAVAVFKLFHTSLQERLGSLKSSQETLHDKKEIFDLMTPFLKLTSSRVSNAGTDCVWDNTCINNIETAIKCLQSVRKNNLFGDGGRLKPLLTFLQTMQSLMIIDEQCESWK